MAKEIQGVGASIKLDEKGELISVKEPKLGGK